MRVTLEALIFDVDGTLADTEELHRMAFNHAFADAGIAWDWSVSIYNELLAVTGGRERIKHYIQDYAPEFTIKGDLDAKIADLHKSKTAWYVRLMNEGRLGLRPGIARLIDEARAHGVRLAIATTTTLVNVEVLFRNTLGIEALAWFEVVGAGDVVPAKKPAPDIYYYVLDKLAINAANCIALEDSANGLHSALSAGLATVITVNNFTRTQDFNGALLVVDQCGEPDQPFSVLQGNVGKNTYLDVPFITRLLEGSN